MTEDRFKYRVWSEKNKSYIHLDIRELKLGVIKCDKDDDLTFEQCTGIIDINGNLVYEGDVVKRKSTGYNLEYVFWHKELACFRLSCVFLEKSTAYSHKFILLDEIEVVGNILKLKESLRW